MEVKVYKEPIFWDNLSDDKPHYDYLFALESRMEQLDLNINWVDDSTIEVILPTLEYSYLFFIYKNKKYYFYFESIKMKLANGFSLIYKLDLYATFICDIFRKFEAENTSLKITRSHILDDKALLYKDSLLEAQPKIIEEYIEHKRKIDLPKETINKTVGKLNINGEFYIVGKKSEPHLYISTDLSNNMVKYYVFKGFGGWLGQSFILVPIINADKVYFMYSNDTGGVECFNKKDYMDKSLDPNFTTGSTNTNQYAKNFNGVFLLPNLANFDIWKNGRAQVGWTGGEKNTFFLEISLTGNKIKSFKLLDLEAEEGLIDFNSTKPHKLTLNYWDFRYFNKSIQLGFHYKNNTIDLANNSSLLFSFATCGYFIHKNKFGFIENSITELGYQIAYSFDNFYNYIQSNASSRDVSLNALNTQYNKQMYDLSSGFLKQAGKTGLSIRSLGGGNINSMFNDVFSIEASYIDYNANMSFTLQNMENSLNKISAQYADARRSTGSSLFFSSTLDNAYAPIMEDLESDKQQYDLFEYAKYSDATIKDLNNVIYWYGNFNPGYFTWREINIRDQSHYYVIFDDIYLRTIIKKYTYKNTPTPYLEAIISMLSGGIRLWRETPWWLQN